MEKDNIFPNGNIKVRNIKEIGRIIHLKRKEWAITQKEASGLCNVGTRFFSELENGKSTLEIGKVLKIIKAFGFDIILNPKETKWKN